MGAEPREELQRQTFWTPLHQAVFNNASLDVIQWLLDHGACRMRQSRLGAYILLTSIKGLFAPALRIMTILI